MRKTIAFVLVLLFVLALPTALVTHNVSRVVFDTALVKSVFIKQIVQSDLISVTLEWFSYRRAEERVRTGEAQTGIREPDVVKALQFLDRDEWRKIKAEVLPNEILIGWLSAIADGVYAWIDTNDPVPNIALELKPWKDYTKSMHGVNAIQILYDALPPCSPEEIGDFVSRQKSAPSGTTVLYNLGTPCAFPLPWRTGQVADYRHNMDVIIDSNPDRFDLTQALAQIAEQQAIRIESIKQQLRAIRTLVVLSPLFLLALVGSMLILVVRSVSDLGRWVGLQLVVGGLVCLTPPLAYQGIITILFTASPMGGAPQQVQQEFVRVISILAAEIFQPMYVQALVIIVVGAALTILGIVVKQKSPAVPQANPREKIPN